MSGEPANRIRRWWRFGVLRGDGIPAYLNGRWLDIDEIEQRGTFVAEGVTLDATNEWEQRDDGEVAVVYRWVRQRRVAGGPP